MQHLPAPIHHAWDAAQLPVAIDYPAALALRQMSMVHDELPKYLLAPEVSACSITSRICAARCCWPHCGTPVRALMKHWR